MNDVLGKLLGRNRAVSIFLYILGTVLSGILCWGFVLSIQQGLGYKEAIIAMPAQLEIAWGTIIGLIVGGHEEEINKAEKMLNKDLDKDGDIGLPGGESPLHWSTKSRLRSCRSPPRQMIIKSGTVHRPRKER